MWLLKILKGTGHSQTYQWPKLKQFFTFVLQAGKLKKKKDIQMVFGHGHKMHAARAKWQILSISLLQPCFWDLKISLSPSLLRGGAKYIVSLIYIPIKVDFHGNCLVSCFQFKQKPLHMLKKETLLKRLSLQQETLLIQGLFTKISLGRFPGRVNPSVAHSWFQEEAAHIRVLPSWHLE